MQLNYRDIVLDEGWGGPFKWFVALSLIFHALVIYFSVAILPDLSKPGRPEVDLYTVQFLPLPPGPPPAAAEKAAVPKPAATPKPAEKSPEEAAPPPEPAAKPKPVESTPLVPVGPIEKKPEPEIKRTDTPPPEPKVEVEKPKPKPTPPPEAKPKPKPKPNPDAKINSALENLEKKVQAQQEEKQLEERMAALKQSIGSNEGEVTAEGGAPDGQWVEGQRDLQLYLLQIYNIIQSNWNLPPESAVSASGKLTAAYRIQVAPSGEVVSQAFKSKSGEDIFDSAIENAIKNSRLPKMPDALGGRTLTLDLYFTPEGVRRG